MFGWIACLTNTLAKDRGESHSVGEFYIHHTCRELYPASVKITPRFYLSTGIIFSWGEVWKEMRRFSMRTLRDFGFGRIQSMESVIDDEITLVLSSLENVTSSKKEMSMRQFFTVSILNILWSMVAGFRFSHEDVKLKKLINLIDETSKNNPAKAGIVQAFPFLFRFVKNSHRANRRRIFIEEMQNFFRVYRY